MCSLQGVPVFNSCVRIKTTLGQREEISEKLSCVHSRILFICSTFTQSTNTHLITAPTPRKRRVNVAMFTSYTRSQAAAQKTALAAPSPSVLENTRGYIEKWSDHPLSHKICFGCVGTLAKPCRQVVPNIQQGQEQHDLAYAKILGASSEIELSNYSSLTCPSHHGVRNTNN